MKYLILFTFCLITGLAPNYFSVEKPDFEILGNKKVSEILSQFGVENNNQADLDMRFVSAELGEEIVKFGESSTGKKIKKQSKHFECTACHNLVKEDPDLSNPNPEDRLSYALKKDLPFLQGSTLYGVVNRVSYYNGDYYKKYGDLVTEARNDLRASIQLCATECAQGRRLKSWELESVVAYLNTIDLKLNDLDLSSVELKEIDLAYNAKQLDKRQSAASLIQSKYSKASSANFIDPPEDRDTPMKGNAVRGKNVYEKSCLHCHENGRYSFFNLDQSDMTFKYLKNQFPKYNRYSVYQIARYGTSPKYGKRSYMPHYTADRMSENQLEDLRAYIYEAAK